MRICVFCSSVKGGEAYRDVTEELGRALGSASHELVFGGFDDSLMGAIADGFASVGAPITGVVPATLATNGGRHVHPGCTEVIETADLAERKARMIELSDAFIAAPGGIGTLDEVYSVLAQSAAGECLRPVVLYDVDGFYQDLWRFMEDLERKGFLRRPLPALLGIATTGEGVVAEIERMAEDLAGLSKP